MLAFVGGLMVFRQTHAIWTMESPNAVTINASMNFAFGTGYTLEAIILIVTVLILAVALMSCVHRGF